MLGRSAASKIIYVRPVGSPKTLQILEKILTSIIWRDPLDPHSNRPAEFFVQKLFMAHFRL